MPISLTPGQAVFLHGWWNPVGTLSWSDVVAKDSITFDRCRAANLSPKQLHALQADISAWVQHGGVTIRHAAEMADHWRFHALRDLKADLADVLAQRFSSQTLRKLGVTYDDLLAIGMSPESMVFFGFTVLGWTNLGFTRQHLRSFSDAQIHVVFALTRPAAEHCLSGGT